MKGPGRINTVRGTAASTVRDGPAASHVFFPVDPTSLQLARDVARLLPNAVKGAKKVRKHG
jgi:hypothetical protein